MKSLRVEQMQKADSWYIISEKEINIARSRARLYKKVDMVFLYPDERWHLADGRWKNRVRSIDDEDESSGN